MKLSVDVAAGPRGDARWDPFVLVHGGWHGGWCWDALAPILRAVHHRVYAPTLTGLAERAHLLTREVGLDTHVEEVVDLMVGQDLREAVLVGHSYAGMVIAAAACRVPDRVARLVFLDAFVPVDGASVLDLLPPDRREDQLRAAREGGEGWRVPAPPAALFGLAEAAASAVDARLTPHPLRSFQQPARLNATPDLPRCYIHCADGPVVASFAPFAERYRNAPGWECHELATGHDAMLIAPEALGGLLLQMAARPEGAGDGAHATA